MYEQQNTYVMFHRIKTILLINNSYTNDTNKLFKTTLVTIKYNLRDYYFRYIYVF